MNFCAWKHTCIFGILLPITDIYLTLKCVYIVDLSGSSLLNQYILFLVSSIISFIAIPFFLFIICLKLQNISLMKLFKNQCIFNLLGDVCLLKLYLDMNLPVMKDEISRQILLFGSVHVQSPEVKSVVCSQKFAAYLLAGFFFVCLLLFLKGREKGLEKE